MGNGNAHDRNNPPVLLLGGGNGRLKGNRHIDLVLVTIDDRKVRRRAHARSTPTASTCTRCSCRAPSSAQHRRGLDPQLVHALAPREGPPALHARRDDRRRCASGCSDIGERDTRLQLLARRHRRAAADRQGAQVVRHARRPRLHRALDPLRRRRRWRASRSIGARPAGGPRGDAAGAEARTRRSSRRSTPTCSTPGRPRERVQAALDAVDGYVADRAPALFAPVIDHLREAGEARSCDARSRTTSSGTFGVERRDDRRASTWPTRAHRQGVVAGAPHEAEQRRGAGARVLPLTDGRASATW